jgi:hypothetical protein
MEAPPTMSNNWTKGLIYVLALNGGGDRQYLLSDATSDGETRL